ncbi:HD-GYP domain-containing protein [Lysinibacillus odysseyi]|uniref:Histidine kinase n=1 Tax=Lysinibacillus odysseyi 34hs-1 = NBRC 100172 TaxID=1220589 RepID=A0A0A3ICZ2_9BACI|nr:HD-GYP domain-containing protein [Lysinibacillus odysseyi]KGR82609.1 histidine kinase [Lysinibacillus odysseyi 34hs-1 = NBRC 100172]
MRLISINVLRAGMVVGRTIWNEAGHPLLQKGVVVTDGILVRLKQLNIHYIYIEDRISYGIEIEETVEPALRSKIVNKITESFHSVRKLNSKQISFVLDQQSKAIGNIVEDLLQAVLDSKEILMVLTDAFMYDEYLYQHSFQVTLYSLAIGKEMGYSYEDLRLIGMGALLHDIGKLMVPKEILLKPDPLTDEEYEIMKQHTKHGFDLLRNLHSVSLLVAHCAFQHHERLDGSGYPRGIMDAEIHPFAKIIGVADVFDAVTSNRVYREKLLPSQGMAIIEAGSGTIFSPAVVQALRRSVVHYPNGSVLLLSDGRRGIVSKQNSGSPERPKIRVFEEDNMILPATYEMNLVDFPDILIDKVELEYAALVE